MIACSLPNVALMVAGAALATMVATGSRTVVSATAQSPSDGWQIPDGAAGIANPVALSDAVIARGHEIYRSKCQRCHGATGVGNGRDASSERRPADLTDASRATSNPDGVLFYKIWNGRSRPRMPAFKTDIPRDDVWAVVHYIKTLRAPAGTTDTSSGAP